MRLALAAIPAFLCLGALLAEPAPGLAPSAGDEAGGGGVCDPAGEPWIYPTEAEDINGPQSLSLIHI